MNFYDCCHRRQLSINFPQKVSDTSCEKHKKCRTPENAYGRGNLRHNNKNCSKMVKNSDEYTGS